MKIKMIRHWKPHYTSRWMYKGSTYNSDHIHGGIDSAKRAIGFGFAVEEKDPNAKAISCGESLIVKKAESRQTEHAKSEMTKEQLRDEIRSRSKKRKEESKARILDKLKGNKEVEPAVEAEATIVPVVEPDAIEVPNTIAPIEVKEELKEEVIE